VSTAGDMAVTANKTTSVPRFPASDMEPLLTEVEPDGR